MFSCQQRLHKECVGGADTKQVNVPIGIGEGSHIKKAIIDKNAKIGRNVKVIFTKIKTCTKNTGYLTKCNSF